MKRRCFALLTAAICLTSLPVATVSVGNSISVCADTVEYETISVDGLIYEVLFDESLLLVGVEDKDTVAITLPATVNGRKIQIHSSDIDEVFSKCSKLESISVEEGNENYFSHDGVLYERTPDYVELLCYPKAKAGSYDIPEGVNYVAEYAFANCKGLTKVTIPDSMLEISDYAFLNCTNLKVISGAAPLEHMNVIDGCKSLTHLELKKDLESSYINLNIYLDDFPALKELIVSDDIETGSNGVTIRDCPSLTTLDISKIVMKGINGRVMISQCDSLTELKLPNVSPSDEYLSAYDGVRVYIQSCPQLKSISVPDTTELLKNMTINACPSLLELQIPNNNFRFLSSVVDQTVALSVTEETQNLVVYGTSSALEQTCIANDIPFSTIAENILCGDVNLDGKVDLMDCITLSKVNCNLIELSETQQKAADCDANGTVDDNDEAILIQYVIMLISDLPYIEA